MKRICFSLCMLCGIVVWGWNNTDWELNDINRNLERLNNTLDQQRRDQKEYQDRMLEMRRNQAHRQQFYARLYEAHPDAEQIIGSREFQSFLSNKSNPTGSILTAKRNIGKAFKPFVFYGKRMVAQSPDKAITLLYEYKVYQGKLQRLVQRLTKAHPDAFQIFESEEYKKWVKSKPPVFDPKQKTMEDRLDDKIEELNEFKTYQQGKIFYQTLYKAHPDVQKIVKTKQFHDWFAQEYDGQPLETVFRPFSPDGKEQTVGNAISCLNKYKKFLNKDAVRRSRTKVASSDTKSDDTEK